MDVDGKPETTLAGGEFPHLSLCLSFFPARPDSHILLHFFFPCFCSPKDIDDTVTAEAHVISGGSKECTHEVCNFCAVVSQPNQRNLCSLPAPQPLICSVFRASSHYSRWQYRRVTNTCHCMKRRFPSPRKWPRHTPLFWTPSSVKVFAALNAARYVLAVIHCGTFGKISFCNQLLTVPCVRHFS